MLAWVKRHWEALAIGAGAGVLGLVLWEKRSAASQTVVVNPTPPAPAPAPNPGGSFITLVPNQPTVSYGAAIGSTVSISLPAGAYWINNGSGPASGNAPVSWTYQGPGVVNFTWVDATMQPQTTQLSLTTN